MATEKIMEVKGGGPNVGLQQLRTRLATYQREIRTYLDSLEADVDNYKFTVEKAGDGVAIDVAIRATVHPKNKAGITK